MTNLHKFIYKCNIIICEMYRYDGRGALSDLRSYEASREGFDAMRWLGLSDSERKLEELCDKERYYALEINEEEEEMYKGTKYISIWY